LIAMLDAAGGCLTSRDAATRTAWIESNISAMARKLTESGKLRIIAEQPLVFASGAVVNKCAAAIRDVVGGFHKENPLLPGMAKQDLRARVSNPRDELFETCLRDLVRTGVLSLSGDIVLLAGRAPELTPDELRAKALIEREFQRAGLAVPSFAAVLEKLPVEAARAQKILKLLLREKTLIEVTKDLVFHRAAVTLLRTLLAKYRSERGERLPIAAFKELTGVSRKYAIPLLEYLDRERVTKRVGDERVII
jgi:selenocysteine-specific elongation factor